MYRKLLGKIMNRYLTSKEFDYILKLNNNSPLTEQLLYEMANVEKSKTGLPYDIWIDDVGVDRGNEYSNSPRLKVNVNGELISMTISDNPDIPISIQRLGKISFPNKDKIQKWIKAYKNILLAHYYKKISNIQALSLLGPLKVATANDMKLSDILKPYPDAKISLEWDPKNFLYEIKAYSKDKVLEVNYAMNEYEAYKEAVKLKDKYQCENSLNLSK